MKHFSLVGILALATCNYMFAADLTPPPVPSTSSGTAQMQFAKGWNLIGVPFIGSIQKIQIADGTKVESKVWQYDTDNSKWVEPTSFTYGWGYWVYANEASTATVTKQNIENRSWNWCNVISTADAYKWYMLATPVVTSSTELKNCGVSELWAFDTSIQAYRTQTDYNISAGEGFWIRTNPQKVGINISNFLKLKDMADIYSIVGGASGLLALSQGDFSKIDFNALVSKMIELKIITATQGTMVTTLTTAVQKGSMLSTIINTLSSLK